MSEYPNCTWPRCAYQQGGPCVAGTLCRPICSLPPVKRVEDIYEKAARLERALQSIAANTCCVMCREAALVAKKALEA